jgi:HSP20 family molecular chaperone IbpA
MESFIGQFHLPQGAEPEQARAEFKDGVLHITVPLAESSKNIHQIPVQKASSSTESGPTEKG